MKFTCTVDINLPKNKVAALFTDENNLKHWQDGFESITLLTGNKNEIDSTYLIKYKNLELKETILKYNMPNSMKGLYEHKMMTNTMENTFTSINENTTRWTAEIHYKEVKGIMKFFNWIMPNMPKKQTQKWLDQFKKFAENQKI